ncbi:putative ABC transporter permease [Inconstantimicrobium mannanitabidum]|uniref:Membrane protein n=1 Tax=Inconstantimicrobium mannanitabidum TaxID=1604901 RepID=A0ACB5RAQ7_9CLOT|nr:hypothetical protein [Clostridium sp. TW13]GKX66207.1 membrane protein [Clostridium sp. TW13]
MKYSKNKIIHFFVFGSIYMNVEIIARIVGKQLVGYKGIKPLSLMGYTSLWMFAVGGICGVLIGSLNDHPRFYDKKIWQQILIGGTTITLAELFSGILLNLILGLNIWDYSKDSFNFMGQIELKNCLLWYLMITPIIIWFDDMLTYYLYKEGESYNLLEVYKKLIKLK